jgi:hypothetical protein
MSFLLTNTLVLGVAALFSWWLSGFDSRLTGGEGDNVRRGIRCGISLLIVEVAFCSLWRYYKYEDRVAGLRYLAMLVPLALVWVGCISEALAQGFNRLIDPEDKREYDPKRGVRELDAVGELVRRGQKKEAIQLCRELMQRSEENRTALELTLHHLDVPVEQVKESKPLAEARGLRLEGNFKGAEAILKSLLRAEPSNVDAAMLLMRLYTQDLRQKGKAIEVLQSLEKQRYVSRSYIEFARRSIEE